MRKWHRWLSVFFGVFLLWIAVTGVLSQIPLWGEMLAGKEENAEAKMAIGQAIVPDARAHGDDDMPAAASASAAPTAGQPAAAQAAFVCPETMTCRPKKPKSAWNVGLLHHLHSGESFGAAGTVIATLSGLAMVFFSFSGLWMYISMWRNRKSRDLKPGWFWK